MKKLRLFDSLKFVRFIVVAIVCTFILNVAHADTNAIQSVIAYGKTEQSGTPTPTNPVPIMTNNGVLKVNVSPSRNLFDINTMNTDEGWYVGSDDTVKNVRSSNRTIVVPCKPNTKYSVWHTEGAGGWRAFGIADNQTISEDVPVVWKTSVTPAYKNKNVVSVITTGDTHRMFIIAGRRDSSSGISRSFDEQLSDFMVVEGELSTATAYELYSGPNGIYADGMVETIRDSAGHTATAQMLLSVGDYKDEQEILSGTVTRKVGVKVLDGTEDWNLYNMDAQNVRDVMRVTLSSIAPDAKVEQLAVKCTHLVQGSITAFNGDVSGFAWATKWFDATPRVAIRVAGITTVAQFKQWLADQYANGTPVIVVYPLETETTESLASESVTPLTTAPVRQTAGSILGMPIEVVLGDGTREWVSEIITIATTRYNEERFAPVKTDLSAAVNAVEYVVSNTMSQAQAIDTIATSKQTRPDESCPPFKKCLLVEGEDGTPHWYEIYDPINDFLNPILAAARLSGNQGAPIMTTHTENGSTIYDTYNGFCNGSGAFREKYIDNSTLAADRPFGPATGPDELPRCADNATRTTSVVYAGLCYNTGGMFRELTEGADDDAGEWAVVYKGNEGGASLGITPGVVYGVAKCTTVGQHTTEITGDVVDGSNYWWPKKLNNYATSNPTTLASLISDYPNSNIETVFNTLPNPYGTDEKPGYPRDNFQNCWCKMTAIGVPGAGENDDQRYANGTIMSVSGGWVFDLANMSATQCAYDCANSCANRVRASATFRRNVLTVR